MIREINPQKTVHETAKSSAVNNAASKSQSSSQALKSSALTVPVNSSFHRSAASLAAAAGLPSDKLSSSIVSFARFFSLPLKPGLLAAIRKQAFLPSPQVLSAQNMLTQNVSANNSAVNLLSANKNAVYENAREALSLAAAAAESKGAELNQKGLEAYAGAVDPDWQKRQDKEDRRGRRNTNQQEQEDPSSRKSVPVTPDDIKKMALESSENDPLLAIMNRLPCKNGQRWIVLPFNFSEDGREFNVSIRILLENENCAACMAMDISVNNKKLTANDDRWVFVMDAVNNKTRKLTVYLNNDHPRENYSGIKKELSKVMDIPLEDVSIINSKEAFPCEAGCGEMPAIYRAV